MYVCEVYRGICILTSGGGSHISLKSFPLESLFVAIDCAFTMVVHSMHKRFEYVKTQPTRNRFNFLCKKACLLYRPYLSSLIWWFGSLASP